MHRPRIDRAERLSRSRQSHCPACKPAPGATYHVVIDTSDNPKPPATCTACGRRVEVVIDAGDGGGQDE